MGGMERDPRLGSLRPLLWLIPSGSSAHPLLRSQEKEAANLAAGVERLWTPTLLRGGEETALASREAPLYGGRLFSVPELIMFCDLPGGRDAAGFDGAN